MTVFKATFERFNFTFTPWLKETADVVFEVTGPGCNAMLAAATAAMWRQCPHWKEAAGPKLYQCSLPKDWTFPRLANSHIIEVKLRMNGYVCFWDNMRLEVHATGTLDAQTKATAAFQKRTRKKVKSYDVTVVLAEKDGEQVTHDTASLG